MKAKHMFIAGAAAAVLPLAAAMAQQGPTPEQPDPQNASPPEQSAPAQRSGGGATFESLDTNGDGKISREEAQANAGVASQFSRYDVNGDGFIERDEVNQANNPSGAPPQQ